MKVVLAVGLFVILLVGGVQVYHLWVQHVELKSRVAKVSVQVDALERENTSLAAELEYFANPANLLKEFKKLFNYKEPGEKLYIVVPKEAQP